MPTPLRLVVVTPRYWPQAGDLEMSAAHFAEGLADEGAQVTVLTGSWGPGWPRQLVVRGIPVVRVPHAPRGGWNTYLYLAAIGRWLRAQRQSIDLAFAMNLRYEAYSSVRALRGTPIPTVIRSQETGLASDLWWQAHVRFGSRIHHQCQRAAAIAAPHQLVADHLVEAGYEATRVRVIPPGILSGEPRSADRRFRARATLAEANFDLASAEYAPIALYVGRLDDVAGLSHLIQEWQAVAVRWPSARLWLIGDGSARDSLYEQVIELDVRYQTILPGTFEDWSDLFHAADVFLSPLTSGRTQLLLEAMAAGLPVVATDAPELRACIEHGTHGLLVPAREAGAWTAAISQLFENPLLASQMGAAASKLVTARYPRQQMAAMYLELFAELLRGRS